jgi:hypothetical protein
MKFKLINNVQGRMFVAVDSHMRDWLETIKPSPFISPRHSAAMLVSGLKSTME